MCTVVMVSVMFVLVTVCVWCVCVTVCDMCVTVWCVTVCVCRYMERLQQEDWDLLHSKKQTQRELMEEVSKCNEV